ncbi:MAG: hypothetical protein IIW81_05320, partial [Oscillospiraceae bacterium]|nr:hypothetical protein [Oscillospiraceae bacterium]
RKLNMKKALALVLALVLALSMAVSAFGLTFVELEDQTPAAAAKKPITVVNADDVNVIYTEGDGVYYIALTNEKWFDVKVTANGNVTAELVAFDPETMEIKGDLLKPVWSVTEKGELKEEYLDWNNLSYEQAKETAKYLNNQYSVTYYGVKLMTYVNVIKVTVEDNYTAHYTEGSILIEAKKEVEEGGKKVVKNFGGEIKVINDVTIFEYEQLKWTAKNFDEIDWTKALTNAVALNAYNGTGYSDYFTANAGYGADYEIEALRQREKAAVVSTTGFRAIEGEDLAVLAYNGKVAKISGTTVNAVTGVELFDIAAGQKGVNFKSYAKVSFVDTLNPTYNYNFDYKAEELESIDFGFYGDQVVKGAYEINFVLDLDWYDLRELFNLKVEEDDIISYYVVDENGKVVGGKEVDYMTADLTEDVEFTIKGENSKLGQYSIVLEVPAAEVGEANPNTGAESVVGVVAALAVVSVATAAAVSLKK